MKKHLIILILFFVISNHCLADGIGIRIGSLIPRFSGYPDYLGKWYPSLYSEFHIWKSFKVESFHCRGDLFQIELSGGYSDLMGYTPSGKLLSTFMRFQYKTGWKHVQPYCGIGLGHIWATIKGKDLVNKELEDIKKTGKGLAAIGVFGVELLSEEKFGLNFEYQFIHSFFGFNGNSMKGNIGGQVINFEFVYPL